MRLFKQTNIDFIGKRKIWYIVSTVVTLSGIVVALLTGVKYGIDFQGGSEVSVKFERPVDIGGVRAATEQGGLTGAEIKFYGTQGTGVLIRVGDTGEKTSVASVIKASLTKAYPDNHFTVLKEDKIGPKVGGEMRLNALYAVLASLLMLLIYIGFRFKFVYGVGAVVATIHDILVAFAAVVIVGNAFPQFGLEINQSILAAFLTIVGFSVNDTVVIFDRIREDLTLYKGENLVTIMNRAINQTLSRTVITSGTVFLIMIIFLFFGGDVLRGFAFTMTIGVITGTYSSIFVASALVIDWKIKVDKLDVEGNGLAKDARSVKPASVKSVTV